MMSTDFASAPVDGDSDGGGLLVAGMERILAATNQPTNTVACPSEERVREIFHEETGVPDAVAAVDSLSAKSAQAKEIIHSLNTAADGSQSSSVQRYERRWGVCALRMAIRP